MVEEENLEQYIPPVEFEFIEVDRESESDKTTQIQDKIDIEEPQEEEGDEFDFPLFSAPIVTSDKQKIASENEQERGRSKNATSVMKVSLREESLERVVVERPPSYYFASYTEKDKQIFQSISISADDIYKEINTYQNIDPTPWKCIDLNEYNKNIQLTIDAELNKKKRKRPGKAKRECIIKTRMRVKERNIIAKKQEEEKLAKLKRKIYHKRGGKKHKKTKSSKSTNSKEKPKLSTK